MSIVTFVLGAISGGSFGFLLMGALVSGSREDDCRECVQRERRKSWGGLARW